MEDTGASTVSSDASSAPAPDAAATSAPPAATDSTPAAADAGTDAAASTETGAPAAPSSLDEIWKDFSSRKPEEEAAPAAPAPQADADKAEATPEPEEPKAGEEKPAEEQTPDADAEEAPAEADPLDDEPTIPTRDEINEKFSRAPKGIRDLAADLAEKAAAAEAKLAEIGGAEGAEVAKAIIPHLFEAQPGPAHANAMFDALVEANAPLVATMGEAFINAALDDERTGPAFADRLLEQKLGEGYTLARVEELVALDREGLIDVESLKEDLGTGREPTARERELETQLTAEKARVKELTGGKEDATRREEQRLADTVETAVTNAVGALVQPLAEKIGWVTKEGATGPHAGVLSRLGKLANAELQAAVKQMPEYDQIQQLVKEGRAFKDGKPTQIMRVKLDAIQRRGLAHFKQTARELRPAISLLAGQNAAAPNDPPPPSTAGRSGDDATTQPPAPAAQRKPQSLDEINAEYDRRMREAREPVGTTRRR